MSETENDMMKEPELIEEKLPKSRFIVVRNKEHTFGLRTTKDF